MEIVNWKPIKGNRSPQHQRAEAINVFKKLNPGGVILETIPYSQFVIFSSKIEYKKYSKRNQTHFYPGAKE